MSEIDLSRADVPVGADIRHINAHAENSAGSFVEPYLRMLHNSSDLHDTLASSSAERFIPHLVISNQQAKPENVDKPVNYSETLDIDGIPRHYNLHVPPSYDASKPVPLVLALHGHGDDAAGAESMSGLDAEADKNGFIVAYPQAMQWMGNRELAAWNTGNGLVPPGCAAVDDSAFLRKVIDRCQNQFSIDHNRTYLVGYSNGGMEAYKAASDLSDKLAAVVAVSGAMSGSEAMPKSPVSILSIVGTSDNVVPPGGRTMEEEAAAAGPHYVGMISKLFPQYKDKPISSAELQQLEQLAIEAKFVPQFKPVTYATNFWKEVDGITGPGTKTAQDGISTEVYTNPQAGLTVEQETIAGGDHEVLHGTPPGFNTADNVWEFLKNHPRNSSISEDGGP